MQYFLCFLFRHADRIKACETVNLIVRRFEDSDAQEEEKNKSKFKNDDEILRIRL